MTEPEAWWPQDARGARLDGSDTPPPGGRRRLIRFGLLALATLGLIAAGPAYAYPFGCVLFGWDEIVLARWLKRADPIPTRGRACSLFYLAWGLWRISLAATGLMFLVIMAQVAVEGSPKDRAREVPTPPEFASCGVVALVGLQVASAVSAFAAISCLRQRVRAWVGPEVRWARSDGIWPPQVARRRRETVNRAKTILIATFITGAAVGVTILLIASFSWRPAGVASPGPTVAVIVLLMVGVPISILLLLGWLKARIMAPTPADCWSACGP